MTTAIVCIALLALGVFGLGLAVSLTRGKTGINYGMPDDPTHPLLKLGRAHGNAAEYAAIFGVLFLALALNQGPVWAQWVMAAVTACRYLHMIGMIAGKSLDGLHPLRLVGALGTYLGGFALCVALVLTL